MWAEIGRTYEIERRTEYFDNDRYVVRVRRDHPNWRWAGINNGRWRPPLTQGSEILEWLETGTRFTVTNIRYQAMSGGKAYQAIEARVDNGTNQYDQNRLNKPAFIWIWHNNVKCFREAPQPQPDPAPPGREWRRHEITDEELHNGLQLDWRYSWEVVFPVFRVRMNRNEYYISEQDKFTLTGKDENGNVSYRKTLTVAEDKIDNNPYIDLHFQASPRSLKYWLDCTPGTAIDDEGNERSSHNVFEDKSYTE